MDLSGYFLTDDLANTTKWAIPAGTHLQPHGFLLVWADGGVGSNGNSAELHAGFRLDQAGESIGLFTPDGRPVDRVTFGRQTSDVSQGRWPDGHDGLFQPMRTPTPSAPNVASSAPAAEIRIAGLVGSETGVITVRWLAQSNRTYRLEFKQSLSDAFWIAAGQPVRASGNTAEATDTISEAVSQRFYRVVLVE